jgi:hypothetical protein
MNAYEDIKDVRCHVRITGKCRRSEWTGPKPSVYRSGQPTHLGVKALCRGYGKWIPYKGDGWFPQTDDDCFIGRS